MVGFLLQVLDTHGTSVSAAGWIPISASGQISIGTGTFSPGTVGQAYLTGALTASGGNGGPYTWSLDQGTSLPPGLTLAGSVISGTPTVAGTANFIIKVSDGTISAIKSFSLTVNGGVGITSGPVLPTAFVGSAYTQTLTASGGTAPYTWAPSAAAPLPSGLTLSSTGVLSGTLSTSPTGTYNFIVTATDSTGLSGSQTLSLPVFGVVTGSVPNGVVGTSYSSVTFTAVGGTTPYSWTFVGAGPPGLSLSTGGVLSGTPTGSGGNYSFVVQVSDSASHVSTRQLSMTITATAPPLAVTCAASLNPTPTVGQPVTFTATGTGGYPGYAYSWSNAVTGSGQSAQFTPSSAITYTAGIQITDTHAAVANNTCTVTVQPAPISVKEYIRLGGRVIAIENNQ